MLYAPFSRKVEGRVKIFAYFSALTAVVDKNEACVRSEGIVACEGLGITRCVLLNDSHGYILLYGIIDCVFGAA